MTERTTALQRLEKLIKDTEERFGGFDSVPPEISLRYAEKIADTRSKILTSEEEGQKNERKRNNEQ